MSLIKELVDLATQLDKSITDRKIRDLFLPLKEKILAVEREQFDLERKHLAEMDALKASHAAEVSQLKASQLAEVANLHDKANYRTYQPEPGVIVYIRNDAQEPFQQAIWFCPNCFDDRASMLSRKTPHSMERQCPKCGFVAAVSTPIDPAAFFTMR